MSSADPLLPHTQWRWLSIAAYALVGLLVARVFIGFFHVGDNRSSHPFHVDAAAAALEDEPYPPHFLYHFALNVFTGFSGNPAWLRWAAALLLSATVIAKLMLSLRFVRVRLEQNGRALGPFLAALLIPLLGFLGPVMNWWRFPSVYLGQFTPNVWHNATIIFAMPLCLAVWMIVDSGGREDSRRSVWGSLLLSLSILVKPNFALAFLPFYFLLVVLRERSLRELLVYALPAAATLMWLYLRAYGEGDGSGVLLRPMLVWSRYSDHPVWSLLLSLAFPASVVLCFGNRLIGGRSLLGAWTLTVISIAQFVLFAEGGPRARHGNFFWGTVPSLYILFLVSLCELLLQWRSEGAAARGKLVLCSGALVLHLSGGVLFFAHSWLGWAPRLA